MNTELQEFIKILKKITDNQQKQVDLLTIKTNLLVNDYKDLQRDLCRLEGEVNKLKRRETRYEHGATF